MNASIPSILLRHSHIHSFSIVYGLFHTTAAKGSSGDAEPRVLAKVLATEAKVLAHRFQEILLYAFSLGSIHSGSFGYHVYAKESQSSIFGPDPFSTDDQT